MSEPITFTLSEAALKIALAEIGRRRREERYVAGTRRHTYSLHVTIDNGVQEVHVERDEEMEQQSV